jgi:hypothetical protein
LDDFLTAAPVVIREALADYRAYKHPGFAGA